MPWMIKEKGGKEDKPKRGKGGEVACISVRRRLVDDIKATTETLSRGGSVDEIKAGRDSPNLHMVLFIQSQPSRQGVHWPQDSCL